MANGNKNKNIQIRATDQDLKGVYSNVAQITHTEEEFAVDFLNVVGSAGTLSARVIVSPGHFKRLLAAMQENMKKYEKQFGTVEPAEEPPGSVGFQAE